ncbi:PREDICTED: uncharacterized protein LOC108769192 isoform X3 [Trachymyrmex cornetzi]|uniref:uncharacterized protein LOC108769192 isoform X3 n=1 Tax=Trachymyrmex cornetzi TaxID=471704 RepID=UPI00084F8461|nr:PREDICTED: uncharacterized protein LOC108769192 isoform X3 [Trachymyrmex cornetzi]
MRLKPSPSNNTAGSFSRSNITAFVDRSFCDWISRRTRRWRPCTCCTSWLTMERKMEEQICDLLQISSPNRTFINMEEQIATCYKFPSSNRTFIYSSEK